MNCFHICCSTDDNYAAPCAVMLRSLCENNRETDWTAHVLVSSLSENNKKRLSNSLCDCGNLTLQFHEVDCRKLAGVQYRQNSYITVAAYYRILLPSVIADDIAYILYLDCDLLILGDISDLYRIDLSNYACAAVKDILPITEEHRFQLNLSYDMDYFNSGVMMINLDYWRKNACENALIEFSQRKRHVFFHDQDALNYVFKGKWFQLSPQWNRLYPAVYPNVFFHSDEDKDAFEQPKIIHFWGTLKPWNDIKVSFGGKYRKTYNRYLKKSGMEDLQPQYSTGGRYRDCQQLFRYFSYRLFRHYMSMHYIYTQLRRIKHLLQR